MDHTLFLRVNFCFCMLITIINYIPATFIHALRDRVAWSIFFVFVLTPPNILSLFRFHGSSITHPRHSFGFTIDPIKFVMPNNQHCICLVNFHFNYIMLSKSFSSVLYSYNPITFIAYSIA